MSRTKRIYNRHPILGGPGLRGWLTSQDKSIRTLTIRGEVHQWSIADEDIKHDYVYRPYGTYCMGNCSICKRLKVKRFQGRRQSRKAATIRELNEHLDSRAFGWRADDPLGHIYDIWWDYVEWESEFA